MNFKQWFTTNDDAAMGSQIRAATRFRMGDQSREKLRAHLIAYAHMRPYRESSRTRPDRFSLARPLSALAAVLGISVIGAGTAAAAENSLPGDTLYPIKVGITEPLRGALAISPEAKAEWAIDRAERRINEINTLAARGSLDEKTRAETEERLDAQVRVAEVTSARLAYTQAESTIAHTERRLVAVLRAHEMLLGDARVGMGGLRDAEPSFDEMMASEAPSTTTAPQAALMIETPSSRTKIEVPPQKSQERAMETAARVPGAEGLSAHAIKRQEKAARQRIDSLENLLARLEKRGYTETTRAARAELSAARAALAEGNASYKQEYWVDASVQFNAALRIAIDARDFLTSPQLQRSDGTRGDTERQVREPRLNRGESESGEARDNTDESSSSNKPEIEGNDRERTDDEHRSPLDNILPLGL